MAARERLERTIVGVDERLRVAAALLSEGDGTRRDRVYDTVGSLVGRRHRMPAVQTSSDSRLTEVDVYWRHQSVHSQRFATSRASLRHLRDRVALYPLLSDFMGLWGPHPGGTVLDFGCGPGEDILGFALFSGAERIIGIDLSEKALRLAAHRVALHQVDPLRVDLIQLSDTAEILPLEDGSVDHIHCLGVLHHASEPDRKLREFLRVLRPGGTARVMVYNRDSVFFHVNVAYERHLLLGEYADLEVDEAFQHMTNGPDCPISIPYRHGDWLRLCHDVGFEADYLGGYLAIGELEVVSRLGLRALADDRLSKEHRDFVRSLTWNADGYPMYEGLAAGIGGSYLLHKR
jgi:SAM-dependent methyltransferase